MIMMMMMNVVETSGKRVRTLFKYDNETILVIFPQIKIIAPGFKNGKIFEFLCYHWYLDLSIWGIP